MESELIDISLSPQIPLGRNFQAQKNKTSFLILYFICSLSQQFVNTTYLPII